MISILIDRQENEENNKTKNEMKSRKEKQSFLKTYHKIICSDTKGNEEKE